MELVSDPKVEEVFTNHPKEVSAKLSELRSLILKTAEQTIGVNTLEETLKWGQPSYIADKGSTVRLGWKQTDTQEYIAGVYFTCTSNLVHTFRKLYDDVFEYEGNRAILFQPSQKLPEKKLMHCISLAMTYHLNKK